MERDAMLTPKEAAEYLKVPIETIWRWCRQGTLPAVKIGKYWRIPRKELVASMVMVGTGRKISDEEEEEPSVR